MDNKKLVFTDKEGKEYTFISKDVKNSAFMFNPVEEELMVKFFYDYEFNSGEEIFEFYNSIKDLELDSVIYYMTFENNEEVEIFSSKSKHFEIDNVRYHETIPENEKSLTKTITVVFIK